MKQTFTRAVKGINAERTSKYFYKVQDTKRKKPYTRKQCASCGSSKMMQVRDTAIYCSKACSKVGDRNPNWNPQSYYHKYTRSEMTAFHQAVVKVFGRAFGCNGCGTTEHRVYHWANISGNYKDVTDYISLCVPCHSKFDRDKRAKLR